MIVLKRLLGIIYIMTTLRKCAFGSPVCSPVSEINKAKCMDKKMTNLSLSVYLDKLESSPEGRKVADALRYMPFNCSFTILKHPSLNSTFTLTDPQFDVMDSLPSDIKSELKASKADQKALEALLKSKMKECLDILQKASSSAYQNDWTEDKQRIMEGIARILSDPDMPVNTKLFIFEFYTNLLRGDPYGRYMRELENSAGKTILSDSEVRRPGKK